MSREEFSGVVVPRFWDDFRGKSAEVKLLGLFLITGRHNVGLPGLCVVSWAAMADELEVSSERLGELWSQLPSGFAQYDRTRRVLRVPRVPRHGHRPNHQVIRSWWRRWKSLPDSPLKYAHVDSLRESLAADSKDAVMGAWKDTFETVDHAAMGGVMGDPMGWATGELVEEMDGVSHPASATAIATAIASGSERPAKRALEPSAEARDVAAYLLDAIRSHTPDASDGSNGWARDIDLAIRVDGRSPDRLKAAVDHAHRGTDPFWRSNLLSGKKLRQHFERLSIQASQGARASPRVAGTGGQVRTPDELALWAQERMDAERKAGLR